jgi:HD-GYP domain-containing protein (c-di-GMP phosphodiesterase class II)
MTGPPSTPRIDAAPRPRTRKIVYWFLLVLAAMGLLPLGISAYKLISYSREALVTSQQEAQLQTAAVAARQLNAAIEGMKAQMGRLSEAMAAIPRSAGTGGGRIVPDRTLMERLLGSDFLLVRYTPKEGEMVEARQPGFPRAAVETMIKEGVDTALKGGQDVSDPVVLETDEGQHAVLVVSVPVASGSTPAGALTGVVDFAAFWDPVVGGRRASYLIYALDSQGRLFAAQDEEGILKRADLRSFGVVRDCLKAGGHSALTSEYVLTIDNRPVPYIASCDTTAQGWRIFVQIEKKQAYATVNQMIQATLFWAGLAMVLALGLAYLLAGLITRPIQALAAGTEAFAKGKLDQRVRVRARNELGALADTFNAMADQLQSYIQRLSAAVNMNSELFIGTVKALAEAIDEKDPYTRGHSERVNQYAVLLAKQLGLGKKEIYEVHISSLFHDIGKIGIEDKILRKPAALTDDEYTVMKQHPNKGYQMLSKIKPMQGILPGVRYHHERWDGSGYPMGLKGDQIPLAARIVAIADAFDAMTTNRPYQKAMPFDKAIARLYELSDRAFDRRVVTAFHEAYKAGAFKEPDRPAAYQEM